MMFAGVVVLRHGFRSGWRDAEEHPAPATAPGLGCDPRVTRSHL